MYKQRYRLVQWLPGPKVERRLIVNRHKEPFGDDGHALKLDCGDYFTTI